MLGALGDIPPRSSSADLDCQRLLDNISDLDFTCIAAPALVPAALPLIQLSAHAPGEAAEDRAPATHVGSSDAVLGF